MKPFIKLWGWEMQRVIKPYFILIFTLISLEFIWLAIFINQETSMYKLLKQQGETDHYVKFSDYTENGAYIFIIGAAAVAIIGYSFWIWYRDFQGKGTFMFRLLMLPKKRKIVFFAKWMTIIMMILGLFAVQWPVLRIQHIVFKSWFEQQMIPVNETYGALRTINGFITRLYPNSFTNFLIHFIVILLIVTLIFTFVLLERYLWQRTKLSLFCSALIICGTILIPAGLIIWAQVYLFQSEILLLASICTLILLPITLWFSNQLLTKKMSV